MKQLLLTVMMTVVFWNLENFFEDKPHFNDKCNGIAKTLMMIADSQGRMPDLISLAEVGNRNVLVKLLYRTALYKYGYGIIHYDSPDKRGIDCALLYRKDSISVTSSRPCHLCDSIGTPMNTRDILLVQFLFKSDSLQRPSAILVNHHPSKVGEGSASRRRTAMDRMNAICDSLENTGCHRILCVGDFNDNLWGPFLQGTIKYNGRWEKIDGYFARGLELSETVFTAPHLITEDSKFGGTKPWRSFSGPRYLGGISDHLPIVISIR